MATKPGTGTVLRQRFPRGYARGERLVGAPARGLDSVGHVAWFVVTAIGSIGHALRFYRKEVLRLIAEVSDLNVIAGEEVVGRVTIRLVDVPWDQALDVILLTKALGFVRVGNVLRIAPLETLKLEAEQRLQARRAKEKLEDLVVKLQPVNFADVKEVAQLVKRLLTGRGSANVDQRTNTLIIKDIPSVVHEATALVKAIDTQTPQVMIEAKIVEATLGFSRSLGAVWGVGYKFAGEENGLRSADPG